MASYLNRLTQPYYVILALTLLGTLRGADDSASQSDRESLAVDEEDPVEKRAEIEMGWSVWSSWSTCTRTCDGGASYQLRRCNARQGCHGDGVRYRICSMQPCPEQTDFRAQQCVTYNNVRHQGNLYEWEPHDDSQDPCALTCRAIGHNVVTQLAPKVVDGTRCREGSLDMCINGKCQSVGCDLQLGSTKKVDACGVCGGDGSSCAKPSFYWEETATSTCSATCGGGIQRVKPVCKNKKTGEEVDERLCDLSKQPAARTRECNAENCPASWVTDDWGPCSASCDTGWQERRVYCAEKLANGTLSPVDEGRCPRRQPKTKQSCNTDVCPRWYEAPWSGCSVTCGQGYQTRNVVCRDARGHVSKTCDQRTKPPSTQSCTSGLACHKPKPDAREQAAPIVQPYPPPQAQRYTGTHIVSSEPSFVPEAWGQCSVTCGTGVRRRKVECKIFLEFSRTVARLPDIECPGTKPPEVERCVARPCVMNQMDSSANYVEDPKTKLSYSWRQTGFTPCSASCLGGVRETIIQCIRDGDQNVVSPYLCDITKKPDVITQTCNDVPCPPRWNVSDFAVCDKPCGGGLQMRHVQCVHEVTRGGNTMIVPNTVCTQPPPRAQQFCNVFDCPPRWEPGPWTKCSKSCGGGYKSRKLQCQQVLALGQTVDKSPSHCSSSRPVTSKACNVGPCVANESPRIYFTKQTYVQSSPHRKVSLKVGGKAVLFRGTHLTVKCPVGKFNRSRIRWIKDHTTISLAGRIKVSRNGALRIRSLDLSDSGSYMCAAGRSRANITLIVKPANFWGSSEETMTIERPPNIVHNYPRPPQSKGRPTNKKPGKPKLKLDERGPDFRTDYPWILKPGQKPPTHLPRIQPPPKAKPTPPDNNNSIEVSMKQVAPWDKSPPSSDDVSGVGALVSDQRREEESDLLPPPRDSGVDGPSSKIRVAPDVRVMPHIKLLLDNIKSSLFLPMGDGLVDEGMGDHPVPRGFVLGKGKAENIEFDWMVTSWSSCSQSCGPGSIQVRASQCVVRLRNVSKTVDHTLCVDAGMQQPLTIQQCGLVECVHWQTDQWSGCEESRCTTWNTATQRRLVECRYKNGTAVADGVCNPRTKPRQRRPCYNDQCKGTWRTGEWSECTITCGDSGFRSRLLQCVWFGTKKPAGNACQNLPRPYVVKPCKGPPCRHTQECVDGDAFCLLAEPYNLCQLKNVNSLCCQSCRQQQQPQQLTTVMPPEVRITDTLTSSPNS